MSVDLVLRNANIKTMNSKQPAAQAVAIIKNRIFKVGTNQQINSLIDENTKVVDLDGKTILPGLIDTHIHVADYGRCLMWLDLTGANSISELQTIIKEKVKQLPAGKWIIGKGWNESRFKESRMPQVVDLDEAAPHNPVILYREAAMICVVNSKALKLANLNEHTLSPRGGFIDKNPNTGKLSGLLHDAATSLVWQVIPEPTEEELLDATLIACKKIVKAGLTSVHWIVISETELQIIQKLHIQGKLPFRVNVIIPVEFLPKIVDFNTGDDSMLSIGGAFIVVDGYLDSKEAALIEPYSDDPKNKGKMLLSEQSLKDLINRALMANVQPVIHAMGDKAIDATLSVLGQIQNKTVRFRIEQAAILNKNLINRLKNLKVIISIQPKVISTEFSVWSAKQRLGERACWLHPLKTLLNEGVIVVSGSDCPMEPLSPLLGIQELVSHFNYPEQRLSIEEALRTYTIDAAYCSKEETVKGSIEEGKFADLTILSCDPIIVETKKIRNIAVDFVIVNGKIL